MVDARTSVGVRILGSSFGRVLAASIWLSLGAEIACSGSPATRIGPADEADAPAPSDGERSASSTAQPLSEATSSQTTATTGPAATSDAPTTGDTTSAGDSTTLAGPTTDTGATGEGGDGTGDAETGDRAQARLCSRPYTLSGTPGKGASRGEKSPAAYADENERLRRGFDVAVDRGDRQRWTSKEGIEIDGLDPSERHTIMISAADGKRIRKLVLDFRARGGHDLCLGFDDFYNTWQLRKLRSGQRCGPCVTREDAS